MGNNFIQYTYTATGRKVRQQLVSNGRESTRRDYAGPFVYVNGKLAYINTPHGRVINKESLAGQFTLVNELHIRDHLGNTRMVLEEQETNQFGGAYTVTHVADYYPFGMEIQHGTSHTQPPPTTCSITDTFTTAKSCRAILS